MILSYFKYAFRNLVKQRGRSLINIFGLSFSIAIVIIIFLYVSGELSYNNFHKNADRIYRMYTSVRTPDSEVNYSSYQPPEIHTNIYWFGKRGVPGTCWLC